MKTFVHLIRHGAAGDRERWQGNDSLRPLSPKGVAQAAIIAENLRERPVSVVLSSPAVRCWSTVAPLAERFGHEVDEADFLREGADPAAALSSLLSVAVQQGEREVVACTHGDVLQGIVESLVASDTEPVGKILLNKGVTIELRVDDGKPVLFRCYRAR